VKYIPDAVEVVLPVDIYTEKSVEVPLQGVDFPSDKVLRTFPTHVTVTFQVGMSQFRKIDAGSFHLEVPYHELLQLGSADQKYTVRLAVPPKGASHIRIHPAQVDFLIEQLTPSDAH
jgi:hypothetical protein